MIDTPMEKLEFDNALDLLDILTRALKDAQEKNDFLQRQKKVLFAGIEAEERNQREILNACVKMLERALKQQKIEDAHD